MHDFITGIQQVGIGVANADSAKYLYKNLFGFDVLIFDDIAEAKLMTHYTGNTVQKRRAILTMNLQGGGGFEIWQFIDRKPQQHKTIKFGDLGLFAPKIKSIDVKKSHDKLSKIHEIIISDIEKNSFFVNDNCGNHFQIIQSTDFFYEGNCDLAGVCGAIIGVSNMNVSIEFYKNILGIDTILDDIITNDENGNQYRKVRLYKKAATIGAFANLLGSIEIELIQLQNATPNKIFANRFWGDCGFIHLCFDVLQMDKLKNHAENHGYHFTIDSQNSYGMDNASGRFCYIEDPDGTLIELVETHKVPILKKLNWHLDLRKRKSQKPLPNWVIKLLGLSKVK